MAINLGKNINTLRTQRAMGIASQDASSAITRLSSGMRINNAADDAASLAIADALRADSRTYTKALSNIGDAFSLLNVAQAGVEGLRDILIRISELAEQSANGVYSSRQRQALDLEAQALSAEYSRILQSTSFNGLKPLDGSLSSFGVQLGIDGSRASQLQVDLGISQPQIVWDGTFSETSVLTSPYGYNALTQNSGDFNADGKIDFINSGGGLGLLLGNGNGTFKAEVSISNQTVDIARSADLNNDGDIDIVDVENDNLKVYSNSGSGTFGVTTIATNAGVFISAMSLSDRNGDGYEDVTIFTYDNETTYVSLGNGNGTFKAQVSYIAGHDTRGGVFADANNDGVEDLIVTGNADNYLGYLPGNSDGSFSALVNVGTSPFSTSLVQASDTNADGVSDLVIGDFFAITALRVMIGNGDGTFRAPTTVVSTLLNGTNSFVDLTADGAVDIVRSDSATANTYIYRNNGSGAFTLATTLAASVSPAASAQAFDVTGDGVNDLIVGTNASDKFVVFTAGSTIQNSSVLPLTSFSLSSSSQALSALDIVGQKLTTVAGVLSTIGAQQARLLSTQNFVQASRQEAMAAEARIRDADIAVESSRLLRAQLLQQVGAAVLAQANQESAIVLNLLRI